MISRSTRGGFTGKDLHIEELMRSLLINKWHWEVHSSVIFESISADLEHYVRYLHWMEFVSWVHQDGAAGLVPSRGMMLPCVIINLTLHNAVSDWHVRHTKLREFHYGPPASVQ